MVPSAIDRALVAQGGRSGDLTTENAASGQQEGSTIGGYQLLGLLGKGGMGTVYRARTAAGKIVAVKILAPHLTDNDVLRTRFYLEAKLAMSLDHPNIVRAIDVGEDQSRHFLVMEYIDGETLSRRIHREGAIAEEEALRIAAAVARALEKAHRESLVHRDVKPDNILLTKDGHVKLTDLGLAKKAEIDLDLTRTGRGLGTPHFMAPEQFRDAKNVDFRSDLYSLGATLYVMVTGEVPFRGDGPLDTFIKKSKNLFVPVEQLCPNLGKRAIKTIHACMSGDPQSRPTNAAAVADYLEGKVKRLSIGESLAVIAVQPTWYIKFDDGPRGKSRIKGKESVIKSYIRRGKIGPAALASQVMRGPYHPIYEIPEFRDLFSSASSSGRIRVATAKLAQGNPRPRRDLAVIAFGVTLVVGSLGLGIAAWYFLVR